MIFPERNKAVSLEEAVGTINDGDLIVCGGEFNGRAPVGLVRELIRQGKKHLRLIGHASGIPLDLLCAAGAIDEIQLTRLSFEKQFGQCYNYRRMIEGGKIKIIMMTA